MYISFTPSLGQKDSPMIIPICESSIPESVFTSFVKYLFKTEDKPLPNSKPFFSSSAADRLCWPRYMWSWIGRRLNRPALASIKAKENPFELLGSDLLRLLLPGSLTSILNEPMEPKVPRSTSKPRRDPNLSSPNALLSFFAAAKPKRPSREDAKNLLAVDNPTALDLAPRPVRDWVNRKNVIPDCLPAYQIVDLFRFVSKRSLYFSGSSSYDHRYLIHIEPETREVIRCSRVELKTIAEHDPRVHRDGMSEDEIFTQAMLLGYPRRVYGRFLEIKNQTRAGDIPWPKYVYMQTGWKDARQGIVGGWDEGEEPVESSADRGA